MVIYSWFTPWKWWFSIVMWVYQRVICWCEKASENASFWVVFFSMLNQCLDHAKPMLNHVKPMQKTILNTIDSIWFDPFVSGSMSLQVYVSRLHGGVSYRDDRIFFTTMNFTTKLFASPGKWLTWDGWGRLDLKRLFSVHPEAAIDTRGRIMKKYDMI